MSTAVARVDLDPFDDDTLADPYEYQDALRAAGTAVYLERYGVYAMGRFDDVRAAFTDHVSFVSSRGVGMDDFLKNPSFRTPSLLLETDQPHHTAIRSVMGGIISPRNVRALREEFLPFAEDLVEELIQRETFDAVTDIAERFPLTVFPRAVGIRNGGEEHLLAYGAIVFNSLGPRNERFEDALRSADAVSNWIEASCQRELIEPDGFGAQVWAAADRGDITHDQAPILTRSFLSAGVDTTVFALGNLMHALAEHPDAWVRIHEDNRLRRFAFDETLRWESPVQSFFRTTIVDVEVGDVIIPRDSKVMLSLGAANRDPNKWGERAHEFDLGRATGGHLAFGMGIHQCVGQPIARLEADVITEVLARRVARIELTGEAVPKLNNMLKGWASVPVRIVPA